MASMREVAPYTNPNWTIPGARPAAPPGPGTDVVPSTRPNFTIPRDVPPTPSARDVSGAVDAAPARPAPAEPGWKSAWRSMRSGSAGSTAGAFAKAGVPGVLGMAAGAGQNAVDAAEPPPAPFVPPAAKPGDIPIDPSIRAPAPVQQRPLGIATGLEPETERNLANTINAVSGLGSGVGSGMRALGALREGSSLATGAAKAAPALRSVAPFVQGAQAGQALASTAAAAPTFPPNAQGQPGGTVPGGVTPPPNPAGTIRRVGNSYSADGPISFGATIDDPRNPGAGVTVLPSGPDGFGPSSTPFTAASMRGGFAASAPDSFDTLGDMRRSAGGSLRSNQGTLGGPRAAVPGELPSFGGGGGGGGGGQIGTLGSSWAADRERQNRESSFKQAMRDIQNSNMKPRDKRAAMALAQEQYMGALKLEADQGTARMRESGDMARANLNAGVQRENNAATIQATMRGQDITREGNVMSRESSRMRMQYDMAKDQRDYTTQRADKAFEQRSARESQLQKNLEAANTIMDSDGKPQVDARAVTEMRRGIDRAVARMGIAGPHELGPQAEQQLIAASTLLKTMQENAGYLPWKPDKLKTIDPYDLTGLKVLPNGDRQITRPGQALGQTIPARFFRTEEGARFFGGTPTNRFDMLGAN